VSWHDLVHPHRAEPRQDVLADLVGVRFPGRHLHHVIGQPFLGDVAAEGLPAAARVAEAAFGDLQFGALPCLVSIALLGEGPGALYLAADVAIAGPVALGAVLGLPLLGPAHRSHPRIAWQQNGSGLFGIQRQCLVAIDTKIWPMTSSLVQEAKVGIKPFGQRNCTHNPEVAGSNPAPATTKLQVRGLIAGRRSGFLDRLSAVRPWDLAQERGTGRVGSGENSTVGLGFAAHPVSGARPQLLPWRWGWWRAPHCAVCGSPATRVEIVAPGRVPAEWEQWKAERRQAFEEHRDPGTVSEGGPNPARQAAIGHPFTRGARGAGADEALADRVHPQGGACRAR